MKGWWCVYVAESEWERRTSRRVEQRGELLSESEWKVWRGGSGRRWGFKGVRNERAWKKKVRVSNERMNSWESSFGWELCLHDCVTSQHWRWNMSTHVEMCAKKGWVRLYLYLYWWFGYIKKKTGIQNDVCVCVWKRRRYRHRLSPGLPLRDTVALWRQYPWLHRRYHFSLNYKYR